MYGVAHSRKNCPQKKAGNQSVPAVGDLMLPPHTRNRPLQATFAQQQISYSSMLKRASPPTSNTSSFTAEKIVYLVANECGTPSRPGTFVQ